MGTKAELISRLSNEPPNHAAGGTDGDADAVCQLRYMRKIHRKSGKETGLLVYDIPPNPRVERVL